MTRGYPAGDTVRKEARMRHRPLVAIAAALAVAAAAPGLAASAPSQPPADGLHAQTAKKKVKKRPIKLVKRMNAPGFPAVLATRRNQALYWWRADGPGRIACTGSCAVAWPPLLVPKNRTVPRKIRGIKGTFGVIRRPDGKRQVTYNRYPIYTYHNEGPNEVRCNNVNAWFVARARGLR